MRTASASPLLFVGLLVAALAGLPVASVGLNLFVGGTSATWSHLAATVLPDYIANSLWLCLGVGLGVGLVGTLILSYLAVLKMFGEDIGGRPLLWLGFFCVLGGLQFLTTGVLAELLIRIYYDRGDVAPYHTSHAPELAPESAWHQPH